MNYHSLFLERAYDCRLSSPHGYEAIASIADSAIGGLISLGAQNMTNIQNAQNVRDSNTTSRLIADQNNAIQIAMAREAREWQEQMYERQLQGERDNMYYQHLLNSPMMAVDELRKAGINPALAFGKTGTTSLAAGGAPQASGSGVNLSVPNVQAARFDTPQFPRAATSFSELAQGIAALKASDKSAAEARQISLLTEDVVREVRANAKRAEIAAAIDEDLAWDERNQNLQRVKQDIVVATKQAANLAEENDLIKARAALTRAQEKAEDSLASLRGRQRELAELDIKTYFQRVDSQLKELASRTANNYSQARFTDSQNTELQRMMDYNVQIRQNQAQMSQADVMKQGAVLYDEIDYLLGHYENLTSRERAELEQVKAAADAAKWKYDMRWVDWSLNTIERVNNGVTNWIPFAPDKTTVTDSNSTFDTNMRTDRNGDIMYHDDRTHRTQNERTYVRQRSWQR